MGFHAIPLNLSTKPKGHNLQTFMMVAEKEMPTALHQIAVSSLKTASHENQVKYSYLLGVLTKNLRYCSL